MKTKKLSFFLTAVTVVLVFSCSKSYNSGNNTNPGTVSMASMSFSPSTLTVKSGSTVTWTNNDNMVHTVTADDNSFDSGDMSKGNTFSHTFNSTGTYHYHCKYHSPMTASIIVN